MKQLILLALLAIPLLQAALNSPNPCCTVETGTTSIVTETVTHLQPMVSPSILPAFVILAILATLFAIEIVQDFRRGERKNYGEKIRK